MNPELVKKKEITMSTFAEEQLAAIRSRPMLTTAELDAAVKAIPYPANGRLTPAKWEEIDAARQVIVAALEEEWKEWLSQTYGGWLPDLGEGINDELHQDARETAESQEIFEGYAQIEAIYKELAEKAMKVSRATKAYFRQR